MDHPHIIVIMTDDQGAWALGCAGNTEIHTPNLDRLAATGMHFSNFFCVSPVCSPARASFLTGKIPSQHGVHDWIRSGSVDAEKLSPDLQQHRAYTDEDQSIEYLEGMTGYTDILTKHGYACGLSGKWHLGHSLQPQKGFSHWFTIGRGGCDYYNPDIVRDGKVRIEEGYVTDLITDDAIDYIDKSRHLNHPFYLSVHYTAPHSPWGRSQHPEKYFELYEDCPFESCPDEPIHSWQINSAPTGIGETRREILKGYYAAITAMDSSVGQILDMIEEWGLRENTLIVFTSDNGMNMGHHGIWGKGNGTFPQNMYDTSVKVPFIISRPNYVPQGIRCDHLLSHYDFMPTLLDYLGMEHLEAEALPGKSFAPLLQGKSMDDRNHVVVYDEYGPVRMIRNKQWKYVHRYPYGPHELYDIAKDQEEKVNLIDEPQTQKIVAQMNSDLGRWFHRYVDPKKDGTKEAVTGKGQLRRAGLAGEGRQAYAQDVIFQTNQDK